MYVDKRLQTPPRVAAVMGSQVCCGMYVEIRRSVLAKWQTLQIRKIKIFCLGEKCNLTQPFQHMKTSFTKAAWFTNPFQRIIEHKKRWDVECHIIWTPL